MKKMNTLLVLVLLATVTFTACGRKGGGGGSPTPVDPGPGPGPGPGPVPVQTDDTLITSPTVSPLVAFTQSVVSKDTGTFNEVFPGQANVWTLDEDFSLVDGFDGQFNWALELTVGGTVFPTDQAYSELTFHLPYLGAADGVKVAAVSDGATVYPSIETVTPGIRTVMTGAYAAFLNATSDSRLQQTLNLTSATAPITVSWRQAVSVDPGIIFGYDPGYRVVVRSTDGALLKTLVQTPAVAGPENKSSDLLSQFAGQTVVLSFEEHSSTFNQAYAVIDTVSVKDAGNNEFVANGTFETGDLTGWTTNAPQEVQNVTSGARTLEGLVIKRSFYTVPNKLWGRWVDVYENTSAAPIAKTVTYRTSLGSDNSGIIYYAPGTNDKALTSWDSFTEDRDVGLVFGNARAVTFTSDNGTGVGSPLITVVYDLTVPAGGKVALVNFVIMNGTDTGRANPGTTNIAAKATEIDDEAAKIVSGFWTDPQYRAGMSQQQLDAISNFPTTP